ncbi:MAG: hypothetical protein ACRDSL_06540 [Pseudonocardiaceae bacterium]
MPGVQPPFVAYLRVYEPLGAFSPQRRVRLLRAIAAGPLDPTLAGRRERELWLRSQLATPPRLLPGERADGSPVAEGPADVLALTTAPAGAGPTPLVCPLDVRPRCAAMLLGFLTSGAAVLQAAALAVEPSAAWARAESVLASLGSTSVHVVSSTWTVPLPWFTLVDQDTRQVSALPRPDPARRVFWQVPLPQARDRAEHAYAVTRRTLGEDGPAGMLREIGHWLGHFDSGSVLELDYGGLVQLMDDELLAADTSAADVHAALDALEAGDTEGVALAYERLLEFWAELAAIERHG